MLAHQSCGLGGYAVAARFELARDALALGAVFLLVVLGYVHAGNQPFFSSGAHSRTSVPAKPCFSSFSFAATVALASRTWK